MYRLATILLLISADAARGDDWPTYQHDPARSGVTAARLPVPLTEHWVYRAATPPRPAWPPPQAGWTELPKVDFDDALYTVADRDSVYFGSSVDHQVHALDAATGAPRWSAFSGGPVRLAPTLAGDRLYFGSDDGTVYAVGRANGVLAWSRTLAPEPRRVIANGRVASLWPVRTGVVVADGRVYCGAGVFPYHKANLYALDAATGDIAWEAKGPVIYGGFSPQGYLLATGDSLVAPSGRSTPVFVARDTGEFRFTTPKTTEKGGAAGVYATAVGGTVHVGTQNTLYGVSAETGESRGKIADAERLIVTADSYFMLKGPPAPAYGRKMPGGVGNAITCYDRKAWDALAVKDEAGLKKVRRWRFARPDLASQIAAGSHVIAGGQDEVFVLDAASGELVWNAKVNGMAVGLTVAHGRLIVSTTSGAVHCFAAGVPRKADAAPEPPRLDPATAAEAKRILREAAVTRGFALVFGADVVPLACELARQSELAVACVVPDAAQVPALRRQVAATGLYGHRVTVDAGAVDRLPYPDLAANLVVAPGVVPSAGELLRVLKPCGGVLLASAKPLPDEVVKAGTSLAAERGWAKLVRGELPGSGWWTHQYADAGGSGSSGDTRIHGRLDVLWFGEPGPNRFPDRHQRGAAPLVSNGRVVCQGWNFQAKKATIFCFDEYNGLPYWERDLEGSVRIGLPAVAGNLACDADNVFVADGSKCLRLDLRTGTTRATYETPASPDGTRPDWAYLAVADGAVVGSAATASAKARFSDVLFAYDLKSGKLRWQAAVREVRDTTLTIGSGKLMFADNRRGTATRPTAYFDPPGPMVRTIAALDLTTGKPVWEKEVDLTDCGKWANNAFGTLQALSNGDVLVFGGAYTIYYDPNAKDEIPKRAAVVLSTKDGNRLWSGVIANKSRPVIMHGALLGEPLFYDLKTGEKVLKKQGNKMVPWTTGPRTGGCGSLSACADMVFGRGGYTVWKDVSGGPSGALVGTRPGCMINIVPAGGVVVQAEASSGCSCPYAMQCTVVLRPRGDE